MKESLVAAEVNRQTTSVHCPQCQEALNIYHFAFIHYPELPLKEKCVLLFPPPRNLPETPLLTGCSPPQPLTAIEDIPDIIQKELGLILSALTDAERKLFKFTACEQCQLIYGIESRRALIRKLKQPVSPSPDEATDFDEAEHYYRGPKLKPR